MGFWHYIMTAFALMLVIEGLVYALFPDVVRRMMIVALSLPKGAFHGFGLMIAGAGILLMSLMRVFQ